MRAGWIGLCVLVAGPAQAGLTLCNDAAERASVAIAYASGGTWVSEGWWGIDAGACALVQSGDLKQRNYYYTLSGDGGFAGEGYSFCTQAEAFTLQGADGDCAALAAESRPFSHIDTGAEATDFTFRLAAAPAAKGDATPPARAAEVAAPEALPEPLPEPGPAPLSAFDANLAAAAIPSFVQGQMGEPFTVNAVLQGCGPTEGGDGCTFYAEGARWIAYSAGASNPAAMAVMAALPMGSALQVSGDLIFFGDITAEAAISSLEFGTDPYAGTRAALQGSWVSAYDPLSRLEIVGSEQTDLYGAEVVGVSVLTLADFCGGAQGGVLLGLQMMGGDPGDQLCYEVLVADGNRLEMVYLGGTGSTLIYTRP